ncbi:hypothetical protein COJ48_22295 [Bacillus cereus]|nr:hypothetical protein COJ48_22295 [Bacillus cereus]PGP78544.1 hypothetical protein CN997_20010 [Bacillus cereus]
MIFTSIQIFRTFYIIIHLNTRIYKMNYHKGVTIHAHQLKNSELPHTHQVNKCEYPQNKNSVRFERKLLISRSGEYPFLKSMVLKSPLNENFLSLHLVILRSQLIFCFEAFLFLKLLDMSTL